jgi:hypothetical protein
LGGPDAVSTESGTHYTKLMFFHPVRCAGHVMQSGVSGAPNVKALFFML